MTVADQTIGEFVASVASNDVPPGGGAAMAVSGAMGAALGEMVCNLTVGAEGFEDVEDELSSARDQVAARREHLLELADEDSRAVEELFAAYRTPAEEGREAAIQRATERATEVPLEVAEACIDVVEHLDVVTAEGKESALADAAIGAYLAHSALEAAVFTVRVNLGTIEDRAFAGEVAGRVDEIQRDGDDALARIDSNLDGIV